jgi:hypothetical protein
VSITRTITTAIAIVALAAPTALARTDTPASLAAQAEAKQEQKAHSAGARVGMYTPGATPAVTYTPGTDVDATQSQPGPPTWPIDPKPITGAVKADDGGNGVDGTTIALGIAGSLLAICGLGAAVQYSRTRRTRRVGVAA